VTRRRRENPLLDLEVREQSLLAFRRNLAGIRASWVRGDVDDLPEAVAAADHLLQVLAFVPVSDTPEPDTKESNPQELLRKARLGARQDGLARLVQDTLGDIEEVLGEFRASRDAIRDEMESLGRIEADVPHRIDRIA